MSQKEEKLLVLGEEMRRMRTNMGLSQEKMAERLGTDFRVISRYESGQAEPGALLYRQIMNMYRKMRREEELRERIERLSPEDRELVEKLVRRLG